MERWSGFYIVIDYCTSSSLENVSSGPFLVLDRVILGFMLLLFSLICYLLFASVPLELYTSGIIKPLVYSSSGKGFTNPNQNVQSHCLDRITGQPFTKLLWDHLLIPKEVNCPVSYKTCNVTSDLSEN